MASVLTTAAARTSRPLLQSQVTALDVFFIRTSFFLQISYLASTFFSYFGLIDLLVVVSFVTDRRLLTQLLVERFLIIYLVFTQMNREGYTKRFFFINNCKYHLNE